MIYEWVIGDVIQERWEIIEGPFEGGFGSVYFVKDRDAPEHFAENTVFAVKIPQFRYHSDKKLIEQFEREVFIWLSLGELCKLFVSAHYFIRINQIPIIFVESIINKKYPNNLRDWLANDLVDDQLAIKFAKQIAIALQYAYSEGIKAHGDIKPENIMLRDDLTIKISDWGLGDIVPSKDTFTTGIIGSVYSRNAVRFQNRLESGTLPYMAPELLIGNFDLSPKTDIWSFGIVLYEMLTNSKPFHGENPEELRQSHLTPPDFKILDSINPKLHHLVKKCLKVDPVERFESFDKIIDCLDNSFEFVQHIKLQNYLSPLIKRSTLGMKAFSMFQLGRIDEAWDYLMTSLEGMGNIDIEKIGIIYWEDKDNQWNLIFKPEVIYQIEQLTGLPNATDKEWMARGWLYLELDRLEDSLECFVTALGINPSSSSALVGKAKCLDLLGRSGEAVKCYEEALTLSLDNNLFLCRWVGIKLVSDLTGSHSFLNVYRTFKSGGDPYDYVQQPLSTKYFSLMLEIAIFINKNIIVKHTNLDRSRELINEIGSFIDFEFLKERWYSKDSGNDLPLEKIIYIGNYAYDQGLYEQAIGIFYRALKIEPGNSLIWYNIGTCEMVLGNLEKALEALLKATKINKRNFNAWNSLGVLYRKINQPEKAWEALEFAAIDRQYAKPLLNMAALKAEKGDFDDAISLLENALVINPDYENALHALEHIKLVSKEASSEV